MAVVVGHGEFLCDIGKDHGSGAVDLVLQEHTAVCDGFPSVQDIAAERAVGEHKLAGGRAEDSACFFQKIHLTAELIWHPVVVRVQKCHIFARCQRNAAVSRLGYAEAGAVFQVFHARFMRVSLHFAVKIVGRAVVQHEDLKRDILRKGGIDSGADIFRAVARGNDNGNDGCIQ